ncbi:MAG TPA: carboxypeptidase regulatory-like domain-containing protein, partial [Streptosporangiaceae bacterium]
GVRAVCGPTSPGLARCLSLVRTDLKARTQAGTAPSGYSPADLSSAYRLPAGAAGAGRTVAVVDAYDDPYAARDLAVYRAHYGLSPCTAASGCFRKVAQDGSTTYPLPDESWAAEISLDLDMVSATCPRCRILLVEADSAAFDDLGAAVDEAVHLGAKYVSNSYGEYEPAGDITPALQAHYDALYYDHPGVAVTASSGDAGYGVSYPASSPDVTAVGGTTLTRDGSAARGWTETAWSFAGSGCSASEPKPAWQQDTGCASRTVADVSAVADPSTGVAVYDTYSASLAAVGWNVFGGTSAASPVIASAYALAGTPSPAATPASYPYADPAGLNDVTSGSDGGCSPSYLCTAGPGYDGPTGLGTPAGVAAFRYGVHGRHGDLAGTVTDTATGRPLAGAQVAAGGYAAITDAAGHYVLAATPGSVSVAASAYGYTASTASGVTVTAGQTQPENFALSVAAMQTVSGTVSDGSGHNWPLYAKVSVPGTPAVTYTDPVTGHYRLRLPAGGRYTLAADPVYAGYQQASGPVTVGAGHVTRNLAAAVDGAACAAVGYHLAGVLTENFTAGTIPAGWSIVNPPGDGAGNTWRFDQPDGVPNLTGGTGNYAVGFHGNNSADQADTELLTPVISLSADHAPALRFDDAVTVSTMTESVALSTDGGSTWSTVWANHGFPPQQITVPLPRAAGKPSVRLRFRLRDVPDVGIGDQYWQLDNVHLTNCTPTSGGLVTGQVLDANTGHGVDGATISGGTAGVTATSLPVPGDPRNAHGFYALFSAPGASTLTAAAPGYAAGTATASVTADQATRAGLTMKAGRVTLSGGPVTATAVLGGQATAAVTVHNGGSAAATVNFDPRPGGFTPAEPAGPAAGRDQAAARGYPLIRIPGRFSPAPGSVPVFGKPSAGHRRPAITPAGSDNSPWVRLADTPTALAGDVGAVDPATGKVYAVGGERTGLSLATGTVSVFDPAAGRWSTLPPMSHPRNFPQAAFIGGKLYVTGGSSASGSVPQLDIYDTTSQTWTAGAPVPHAYSDATTVALNGKMYIIGGCDPNEGTCGETDVQVYNPATDQWTTAADYPIPVSRANCGAIAGEIYCAGGVGNLYTSAATAGYAYDPAANIWTEIPDMPASLWGGSYGAADGTLLVSGGVTDQGAALTNQGYAYDPATSTWSPLPNAPQPAEGGGSTCGFDTFGGWSAFSFGGANATAATWQLPGYGGCGGQDWLSATPATVTVPPGQTATVQVGLSAAVPSVTQPGRYSASLRVSNDTPYGAATIPVTFTVTPPKSWGRLAGTVSGTTCAGTTGPLAGATVQVTVGQASWTLTTDPDGQYALWLHSAGRASLITSLAGWQPQAAQVAVAAGATTTRDFTLSQSCG